MGAYATTTSISNIIPGYLDGGTTTSDAAGTAVFSKHIDRAEAMINGVVASRYGMPFSAIPPLLSALAEDIATYFVMRGSYNQDGKQKNQYLEDYKTACETLESIAQGTTKLTYTDGSVIPPLSTARFLSSSENYTPIFGLDDAEKWARDEDEVEDQESARG